MIAPPQVPRRTITQFCDHVCQYVRFHPDHEAIRAELAAHMEDHAAALMERGVPGEEAAQQAVAAMGDPYALGAELDAAHPPTLPRLSRVLLALGLLILAAALVLGFRQGTGLPALSGITPRGPGLPEYPTVETVLREGAASGGGQLGAYTFTPSGQAALTSRARPETGGVVTPAREIQVPLTMTPRRFWLPAARPDRADAVYTDDTGRTGEGYILASDTYLLGASGFLYLRDPAPGAREFSVTISAATGDTIFFTVTLDQEVPPQ